MWKLKSRHKRSVRLAGVASVCAATCLLFTLFSHPGSYDFSQNDVGFLENVHNEPCKYSTGEEYPGIFLQQLPSFL